MFWEFPLEKIISSSCPSQKEGKFPMNKKTREIKYKYFESTLTSNENSATEEKKLPHRISLQHVYVHWNYNVFLHGLSYDFYHRHHRIIFDRR